MKKRVSICIPCYNEESNVVPIAESIIKIMEKYEQTYEYNIQFIDNCSTDRTRELLRQLCNKYPQVRAIFNAKNYPMTSGYHGLLSADGDAVIMLPADFQVPLSKIPEMIRAWEEGSRVICLQKRSSQEGLFWTVRQMYYTLLSTFTEGTVLRNFTGSGMYDKKFLDFCRATNPATSNFLQMVQIYGFALTVIQYDEQKRKSGHSKNNFFSLLLIGLNRFINISTMAPKIAVGIGVVLSAVSLVLGVVTGVLDALLWHSFSPNTLLLLSGMYFIGGIILFFIGLMGMYIIKIDQRTLHAPLVAEAERLNFPEERTI